MGPLTSILSKRGNVTWFLEEQNCSILLAGSWLLSAELVTRETKH